MDWKNAPNHPYFIKSNDLSATQEFSGIIEFPMNTWKVKASYDVQPKLRYMNPAIHHELFKNSGKKRLQRGIRKNIFGYLYYTRKKLWILERPIYYTGIQDTYYTLI